jgi:hypothetical protein
LKLASLEKSVVGLKLAMKRLKEEVYGLGDANAQFMLKGNDDLNRV